MPARIDSISERMSAARTELLKVADSVAAENWSVRPDPERWSAAELIAHLVQVERSVIAKADRVVQHAPRRVPLLKRIHLPMVLVETRLVRRKSPIPVTPELLRGKEEMLAELRVARERTQAFLLETENRNLDEYCWQHPALGMLNVYQWMRFLAAHETRHTKQMREIAAALRKRRIVDASVEMSK
jgi:hypothetical protein